MSRALIRNNKFNNNRGFYVIYDENGEENFAFTPEEKNNIRDKINKRLEERKKNTNT